jgi:hypothetical protein
VREQLDRANRGGLEQVGRLEGLAQAIQDHEMRANEITSRLSNLEGQLKGDGCLRDQVAVVVSEELSRVLDQSQNYPEPDRLNARLSDLENRLAELEEYTRVRLLRLERQGRRSKATSEGSVDPAQATAGSLKAETGQDRLSMDLPYESGPLDYFRMEQLCFGPRSAVMARQKPYLEYFSGKRLVHVAHSGRGELVEMLHKKGTRVRGLDPDPDMAAYSRDLGLPVSQSEDEEYFRSLPDGSVEAILAMRRVERLSPAGIAGWLHLLSVKLAPAGELVIETPNPRCPEMLGSFFVHPNHVRPVPPELLQWLCEQAGFAVRGFLLMGPTSANASCPTGMVPTLKHDEGKDCRFYAVLASKR